MFLIQICMTLGLFLFYAIFASITPQSSLRALRAQLMAQKPKTLAALVQGTEHLVKTGQEQFSKPGQALSKKELDEMVVKVGEEEAKDQGLVSTTVSVAQLLGKRAVGCRIASGGESEVDAAKFVRLGYSIKPTIQHKRGALVIVYREKQYYYGLVVGQKSPSLFIVQFENGLLADIKNCHIACK